MKIDELQKYLRSLQPFLETVCPKPAPDFDRLRSGLEPFQSLTVAEFVDFLQRAEEYARTGIVPTKPGKTRAPAKPKKSAEESIKEAVQVVHSLYERALDADFRFEEVDQQLTPIGKLTIPQLAS